MCCKGCYAEAIPGIEVRTHPRLGCGLVYSMGLAIVVLTGLQYILV